MEQQVAHSSDFENWDNVCRTCLSTSLENGQSLHTADGSLASMVMELARVEIHRQDGLPALICGDCLGELEAAHGFRHKCERADRALRECHRKTLQSPAFKDENNTTIVKIKTEYEIEYDESNVDENDPIEDDIPEDCLSNYLIMNQNQENSSLQEMDNSLSIKIENKLDDINASCVDSDVKQTATKTRGRRKQSFICDVCTRPMSSKASLENHKLRLHSPTEVDTPKLWTKTGYGATKRFHCNECAYNTPYSKAMLYHSRTHTGDKPHKCRHCPVSFAQPSSLKKHETVHSDVMNFSCLICGKQFKHQNKLFRHKTVHSDERPFTCTICNKGFKAKETYSIHVKRHLNVREYSCEQCGATFVSLPSLISHSKSHLISKNFECHFCGLKTSSKKGIAVHMSRHMMKHNFKCELCDYTSLTKYTLQNHMTKHTGEKKFACPVCHLKVTRSTSVNKHMLRAHGIQYRVNDHTDRRFIK